MILRFLLLDPLKLLLFIKMENKKDIKLYVSRSMYLFNTLKKSKDKDHNTSILIFPDTNPCFILKNIDYCEQ